MKVAIIGTGYVGLVTGACLAQVGRQVHCVDTDRGRIGALRHGECPFHEPGLPALIASGVDSGHLVASDDIDQAASWAQLVFLCVGTPSVGGRIDLTAVRRAAEQIGHAWQGRNDRPVLAVKSTVVPGTTESVLRAALERASGLSAGTGFGLAVNPEFLSQGSAVADFLHPDRIVIGAFDEPSADRLLELYDPFDCPKLVTGLVNAELIKYAANSFQATLISFSNQIAGLCEAVPGADEAVVMKGVHLDRILSLSGADGPILAPAVRFLRGGIGFGGSCFPKDLLALQSFARDRGASTTMLDAVLETNRRRPTCILDLLRAELGGIEGRVVSVLGLAFKPDTDDLRESPGMALIRLLDAAGARIRGHDPLPLARHHAEAVLGPTAIVVDNAAAALAGADAAVIATAWPDYTGWNWTALAASMRQPLLIDGRDIFGGIPPGPPVAYRRVGIGRAPPTQQTRGAA